MSLKRLRIFWPWPVCLSRDAVLRVLELLYERQGESLPQHPEFARGQLRQIFSRWDVRPLQDLGQRGDRFGPPSSAKQHRAGAPRLDSTLLSLPCRLQPQAGELGVGGSGLRVAVGLGIDEHLLGNPNEFARGGHDGDIAILAVE